MATAVVASDADWCQMILESCKTHPGAQGLLQNYWGTACLDAHLRHSHLLQVRDHVTQFAQSFQAAAAPAIDSPAWTWPLYGVAWCIADQAALPDQLAACESWSDFWGLIQACLNRAIETTLQELSGLPMQCRASPTSQRLPGLEGSAQAGVDPVSTRKAAGHVQLDGAMVYDNGGACTLLEMGQCPYLGWGKTAQWIRESDIDKHAPGALPDDALCTVRNLIPTSAEGKAFWASYKMDASRRSPVNAILGTYLQDGGTWKNDLWIRPRAARAGDAAAFLDKLPSPKFEEGPWLVKTILALGHKDVAQLQDGLFEAYGASGKPGISKEDDTRLKTECSRHLQRAVRISLPVVDALQKLRDDMKLVELNEVEEDVELLEQLADLHSKVNDASLEPVPATLEEVDIRQVLRTVSAWAQRHEEELCTVMEHAVRQAHLDLLMATDSLAERTRLTYGAIDPGRLRTWWPNVSEKKANQAEMNNAPSMIEVEMHRNTVALRSEMSALVRGHRQGGGWHNARKRPIEADKQKGQKYRTRADGKVQRTWEASRDRGASGRGRDDVTSVAGRGGRGRGRGRGGFVGGGRGRGQAETAKDLSH